MEHSDINAVIIQMRNMGAKYSAIQRFIKSEYDVDMTQQTIRGRYIRHKDDKYNRRDIFAMILQGKTDDEICRKLNIQKNWLYDDIRLHEREYNNWCRTILNDVAQAVDADMDKKKIDKFIQDIARYKVDKDRLKELYAASRRMFMEMYIKRKKIYYGDTKVDKLTIYDIIKKAN